MNSETKKLYIVPTSGEPTRPTENIQGNDIPVIVMEQNSLVEKGEIVVDGITVNQEQESGTSNDKECEQKINCINKNKENGSTNQTIERSRSNRGEFRKIRGIKGESRKVRNERKNARNLGLEYATSKGKKVLMRKMEPLQLCRKKCSETFRDSERQQMFKEYWALGDYDRRLSYIAGFIEVESKTSTRVRQKLP